MHTRIVGARCALLVSFVAFAVAAPVVAAEPFELRGLTGGRLTSDEVSRQPTVLIVWAGWSPRCREIVGQVNAIAARWGERATIATVNFGEERAAVESFLARERLAVPVYLDPDGAFGRAQAVTNLPGLVVFVGGEAVYRGRLPDAVDELLAQHLR